MEVKETDPEEEPKKTPRATIIRRALVFLLALACAGGWLYTRYLVKKGTLGEPCTYDMHCRAEAPRCLKQEAEGDGVCSRPCDTDGDCADKIRCVKVELEDRDERGRPLEGGYCFPQALLDARKKSRSDAGPAARDSWLDVPEAPGQLEAAIALDEVAPSGARTAIQLEVKGSLLRIKGKKGRTIVDTATLRVYAVDDDKKTLSASQLSASPTELKITKTDRTDTVAEQSCEIWQVEETGKPAREACVVRGAAWVDPHGAGGMASALERELAVRGAFPLRISEGDKLRLVVTKLDAHAMPASSFAIPKSYKNLAAH